MAAPTFPIPAKGVVVSKSGKYRYVYKVLRTYRNERGQPTCDKKAIGRVSEDGRLIPNRHYYEFYGGPDQQERPASRPDLKITGLKRIGASFLVGRVLADLGVSRLLEEVFGESRSSEIAAAAEYMACRGNVMEGIDCYGEELGLGPALTPREALSLFASISEDERGRFFKLWTACNLAGPALACDAASFSRRREGFEEGFEGEKGGGGRLCPQLNVGCYFSPDSGLPLFYVTYQGMIIDASYLEKITNYNDEFNINDTVFVLNSEFCSSSNLKWLHKNNYHYIIPLELTNDKVKSAIDQVYHDTFSYLERLQDGGWSKVCKSRLFGVSTQLFIFYHDELAEIQKTILHSRWENQANILRQLSKITSHEAKKYTKFFDIHINKNSTFTYELNMDKLENEDKYCGYFCFLSKLNFDASKILNIYQQKFFIDKELEGLVNYIDKKSPDKDSKLVTAGKLFCSFIGLIASSYIREKVRVLNESFGPQRLTKAKLISELEKIQMVVLGKTTRQVKPLAKIQSRLLASLGVDPNLLQSFELGSHS